MRSFLWVLEKRASHHGDDKAWHRFGRSQNLHKQCIPKVCVPYLTVELAATLDESGDFYLDNVHVQGVVFKSAYSEYDMRYLVGLLNSRLLRWYFRRVSLPFRGNYRAANKQFLDILPFKTIDFENVEERGNYERICSIVTELLALHQHLAVSTGHDIDVLNRRILPLKEEMDALVDALYETAL